MKTSELTDHALNWAVQEAVLASMGIPDYNGRHMDDGYNPSTDWAQGGPIIEREEIEITLGSPDKWVASIGGEKEIETGPTPLIAAMRCYVASKLGEEVEVPKDIY